MKNTILEFDLVRSGEKKFFVEPFGISIHGTFNWLRVNEFLFGDNSLNLDIIGKGMKLYEVKRIRLEIWEDSDDDGNWIDFMILEDDSDEVTHGSFFGENFKRVFKIFNK